MTDEMLSRDVSELIRSMEQRIADLETALTELWALRAYHVAVDCRCDPCRVGRRVHAVLATSAGVDVQDGA